MICTFETYLCTKKFSETLLSRNIFGFSYSPPISLFLFKIVTTAVIVAITAEFHQFSAKSHRKLCFVDMYSLRLTVTSAQNHVGFSNLLKITQF